MKIPLPERLLSLRHQRNLRQEDVAQHLFLERQTYGSYEKGTRTPPLETLIQLADFFEVPIDYLIRDNYPESNSPLYSPISDKNHHFE